MTTVALLYRLTSPSGRAYIGITNNVKKRWQEHANASRCGSKCALHLAIKKYGFENFTKEILVKSYLDYAKDLEVKAIIAYSTMVPAGYNMTAGGDGTVGYIFTEAQKQRMSLAQKGKTMPDDQKQKIRATLKATPRRPEWGENISKAKKGVSQTDEARKIRAESQKLKWADPAYKTRQLELQRLGMQRKREKVNQNAA